MALEIERRFLISKITKRLPRIIRREHIRQGYIEVAAPNRSFRVRISDHQRGVLAFKDGEGVSRNQDEYTIVEHGLAGWVMTKCDYVLEKIRYYLEDGWELDFYLANLKGWVILEKELLSPQRLSLPDWVEGKEVTDFLNNFQLARLAFYLQSPYGGELTSTVKSHLQRVPIIVITGGPGSGKDGIINTIQKEFPELHFTPEVASIVIGQLGIKPDKTGHGTYKLQETIYRVQRLFEMAAIDFVIRNKKMGVVTNRGSVDAAAYLKGGPIHYEKLLRTSYAIEYAKYDLVLCLGTPSREIYEQKLNNNLCRSEPYEMAVAVGHLTKTVWQNHSNFIFIPSTSSWEEKVEQVRREIKNFLVRQGLRR